MKWYDAIFAMGALIFVVLSYAFVQAAEPTLLHAQPLPCGGHLTYWDTNDNPKDGAKEIRVYAEGEQEPRAVVFYGSGATGEFEKAVITIPGKGSVVFTNPTDMTLKYPHPCDIVTEEKGQGT